MQLQNWLNKPYPLISDIKIKILISVAFGLFVFLFLLVFQPFGIPDIDSYKLLILSGYGFVTCFVLFINYLVLPLLFRKYFQEDLWVIKSEILFIMSSVFTISILNYYYSYVLKLNGLSNKPPFTDLLSSILVTVLVGVFPVFFLVFFTELYLRTKRLRYAQSLNTQIDSRKNNLSEILLKIETNLKTDVFKIYMNQLLFIKSEDNYCNIFYVENEIKETKLLRVSLKSIENQNSKFDNIIRCHRSYIVNKDKISKITGNARAYTIHIADLEEQIPVSRKFDIANLI